LQNFAKIKTKTTTTKN